MTRERRRTIFVVIEPDPTERASIAEDLCARKPLQILFFESFRHARALLASIPLKPDVKIEIIQSRLPTPARKLPALLRLRSAPRPA
jgi:hypothetical protein